MIFTLFLNLIYGLIYIVTSPIRLLPDVVLNAGFGDSITTAGHYISSLNSFLPIDTVITLLSIFLAIESAFLAYKLIMWVVRRFPTQN